MQRLVLRRVRWEESVSAWTSGYGDEIWREAFKCALIFIKRFLFIFSQKETRARVKRSEHNANSFDLTTYELFTLHMNRDETSRNMVFITMIKIKENTARDK